MHKTHASHSHNSQQIANPRVYLYFLDSPRKRCELGATSVEGSAHSLNRIVEEDSQQKVTIVVTNNDRMFLNARNLGFRKLAEF